LQRHRRLQADEIERAGDAWENEWDLVFTATTGGPLDVDAFGKSVPRICKEAGLGHWSIHELRHSCASLLLHEDVPLEVVSEQMGHTSIRVTKDVYGHLMPKSREKAAVAMHGLFFSGNDLQPSKTLAAPLAAPRELSVPMDRSEPNDSGVEVRLCSNG
jgi:integrase